MPLDSDIANADSQLHVEFYTSQKERSKGKPYVRIVVPGDKTTVIDQPVREDHKARFPRQWLYFQMQNNEAPVAGTPIADWHKDCPDQISELQVQELQILKFLVVEQVATASDGQLQRIGMGGVALRNHAQSYLRGKMARNSTAELDETKRELAELKAQMAQLMAAQEKRGPGRPPKEKEA